MAALHFRALHSNSSGSSYVVRRNSSFWLSFEGCYDGDLKNELRQESCFLIRFLQLQTSATGISIKWRSYEGHEDNPGSFLDDGMTIRCMESVSAVKLEDSRVCLAVKPIAYGF